jgi:hypothetical protein
VDDSRETLPPQQERYELFSSPVSPRRRKGTLMMDFFYSWTFIGIMAALLVILIVVWIIIRNKRPE